MDLEACLKALELRYGGFHGNVQRRKVSPRDPRPASQLAKGGMQGGDRMVYHDYAPQYAQALKGMISSEVLRDLETRFSGGIELKLRPVVPSQYDTQPNPTSVFHGHRMQENGNPRVRNYAPTYAAHLPDAPVALVELGILRGVGLAIWCDLFPNARVIGLDVDLSHFRENEADLRKRGAFTKNVPEVYEFDELAPGNERVLREILGESRISVMIDDALHYDAAILKAMQEFMPFMAKDGRYFVEDNKTVCAKIHAAYPALDLHSVGAMTVVFC